MDPKTFLSLSIGMRISGLIIFPVLFSFFIGRYVVNHFNTPEYVLYIFIAFGIFTSFHGLAKEVKAYTKSLDKETADKKNIENTQNKEL